MAAERNGAIRSSGRGPSMHFSLAVHVPTGQSLSVLIAAQQLEIKQQPAKN